MSGPLLAGETALVTGAASGIGRAIAAEIAREGARVVLADIAADAGEAAAAALREEGLDATFLAADLEPAEGAERLFRAAEKRLGGLSLLVHSASPKRQESQNALAVTEAEWRAMLGINLEAGFRLGRLAGQAMIERGVAGRILYVTSLHAHTPRNLPHYSAAKAGTTMVMKELARLFGRHGIRVNALAPGAIAGGGFQAKPELARRIALGRVGRPEDLAPMAVALLSQRFGGYVTGTTLVVDGGLALTNWIEPPE